MKEKRWANYFFCGLPLGASAIAALTTGSVLGDCAGIYRQHYNYILGGKPLPVLTEFVLSTAEAFSPALAGLLLGILILSVGGSLLYFAPDERSAFQRTLGCTTVAWIFVFLGLGTALLAFAMPMMPIMYGMQKAS